MHVCSPQPLTSASRGMPVYSPAFNAAHYPSKGTARLSWPDWVVRMKSGPSQKTPEWKTNKIKSKHLQTDYAAYHKDGWMDG